MIPDDFSSAGVQTDSVSTGILEGQSEPVGKSWACRSWLRKRSWSRNRSWSDYGSRLKDTTILTSIEARGAVVDKK